MRRAHLVLADVLVYRVRIDVVRMCAEVDFDCASSRQRFLELLER